MPYVKKEDRQLVDEQIEKLTEVLRNHEKPYGLANYIITRVVCGLKPQDGWSYATMSAACGTFYSAASEFYRRLIAPYEDLAIKSNGDLEEYK